MRYLLCSLLLCLAAPALAADTATWEVSGSWFTPKTALSLSGDGTLTDGVDTGAAAAAVRLDDRAQGGQVEVIWRPTARQRVDAQFYTVSSDRNYVVSESYAGTTDTGNPIYGAIDADVRLDTQFELYSLGYGFDVYQGEQGRITALVGIYGARLETDVRSAGLATVTVEEPGPILTTDNIDLTGRQRDSITRHAPGIGLASECQLTEKWNLRTRVQGFKTSWGDFSSQEGHFLNAQVQLGYEMTDRWTAFAGYNWFDLKLRDELSGSVVDAGTTYTFDGEARGRLRVHGPNVGVRVSF